MLYLFWNIQVEQSVLFSNMSIHLQSTWLSTLTAWISQNREGCHLGTHQLAGSTPGKRNSPPVMKGLRKDYEQELGRLDGGQSWKHETELSERKQ